MKRKVLFAVVATFFAFTATAQTPMVGPSLDWINMYTIPAEFTSNNQTKIAVEENGSFFIYNNSLTSEHQMAMPASGPHRLPVFDFDNHIQKPDVDNGLAITQTLFNNDNKYEYFVIDMDEQRTWHGMSIISEDGSTVWSWHASGNNRGSTYLAKWNGVYFIVTEEDTGNEEYTFTWYRINHSTQSITQVEGPALNVWPTIASKNQTITIELGENCNASEIQVVNAMGQTVKRIPVQAGQTEVQLRTSDLDSGMHIIGTHGRNNNSSCKIIVK